MRHLRHDDRGASLFIVLAFMALISVITLSLLDFSTASFQTTDAVRGARQLNYAAGAAVDLGIKKVLADSTGVLGAPGNPCTYTIANVEGKTATVVCTEDGAGLSPGNFAANALLTTSTASGAGGSYSLQITGTKDLTVGGPIYAFGGIDTDTSSNSQLIADATRLTSEVSTSDCVDNTRVFGTPKKCGAGSASRALNGGTVPAWPAEPATFTVGITNPAPSCSSTGWKLATFTPGLYTQTLATLISAAPSCAGTRAPDTLYFPTGVYYFSNVAVATGTYDVVVGSPNGSWPTDGTAPPTNGTACLATATSPTQFAFGDGASFTVGVTNAVSNVTICAGATSNPTVEPPIALWGASTSWGVPLAAPFVTPAGKLKAFDKTNFFVSGSIFMPDSDADLVMKNKTSTSYDGGLVVRMATIAVSASTKQLKSPYQIPGCIGGCSFARNVLFTATEAGAGSPRIRALVQFTGALGSVPTSYRILSWNVLR